MRNGLPGARHAALASLFVLGGCCLPIQMGAGATIEVPLSKEPTRLVPEVRVGVNPLGIDPLLADRKVDLHTGVLFRMGKPFTADAHSRPEIYLGVSGVDRHPLPDVDDAGTRLYSRETYGVNATFWPGKQLLAGAQTIAQEQIVLNPNFRNSKNFAYGEATAGLYLSFGLDNKRFTATLGASVETPFAGTIDFPTTDAW